jgi:hypothetical protein
VTGAGFDSAGSGEGLRRTIISRHQGRQHGQRERGCCKNAVDVVYGRGAFIIQSENVANTRGAVLHGFRSWAQGSAVMEGSTGYIPRGACCDWRWVIMSVICLPVHFTHAHGASLRFTVSLRFL